MHVLRNVSFASLIGVCLACGGSSAIPFDATAVPLHAKIVVTGLSLPMQYISDPVNAERAYVLEKAGKVKLIVNDELQTAPVLNIIGTVRTEGECGLSGIAFDPDFVSNHYVYLHYNAGVSLQSRIVRYTMSSDGTVLTDEYPILAVDQPTISHKGGSLNFGKDGMLYLAFGDGGTPENTDNTAQRGDSLLGKVLRIDVSHDGYPADDDKNYAIPAGNPFANSTTVLPEIWAVGLRNPFRWSIDPSSGAVLLSDVGQDFWEELNYIPAGVSGLNFGWRIKEGTHTFFDNLPAFSNKFTNPYLELSHPFSKAPVGGFIYRGRGLDPSYRGRYFFSDATTSKILTIPFGLSGGRPATLDESDIVEHTATINASADPNGPIEINLPVSVSPDSSGEVMIVQLAKGQILRLVP